MNIDDEMRSRFDYARRPVVGDLETGLAAVVQGSARRSTMRRSLGAAAGIAVLLVGVLSVLALQNDDPSGLDVTDTVSTTSTTTTAAPASSSTTLREVTGDPPVKVPGASIPPAEKSAAVITVDVDGVVRVNGEPVETEIPDSAVAHGADGAAGTIAVETVGDGVYVEGVLWNSLPGGRVLDVVGPQFRNTIAGSPEGPFTTGEGLLPGGPYVFIDEWGEDGQRDQSVFSTDKFGGLASHASFGPTNDELLLTVPGESCSRIVAVDLSGEPNEREVNNRGQCYFGEIAAWSQAGHVVFARPTEEDSWVIEVAGAGGRNAELTSRGAFQPRQVDVYTDADGRTEALILGTGEELIYVDVDEFLVATDPNDAVLGISNEQNLVSARFVSGFEQHPYRAELADRPTAPVDPTTPESVWDVVGVDTDDTLNARSGPGTEFPIVFEFAADATGVVTFGVPATSGDGAPWVEVYNPIAGLETSSAWVNASFLESVAVPSVGPCLFNGPQDHYIGIDWRSADTASPESDAVVVDRLSSYRYGGCIRTVIELGSEFAPVGEKTPADGLPADIVVTRDSPIRVDFGSSIIAAQIDASEARVDLSDGRTASIFIITRSDGTLGAELYGPSDVVDVRFARTGAAIIIDVADLGADRTDVGGATPIFDDPSLVITNTVADGNRFTITGLARPFEATLLFSLRNADGPVEAMFFDTIAPDGEVLSTGAVMTTGWTEAWGRFEFSIELDPGDVDDLIIDFDPSGGAADDPQIISIPLTDLLAF